MSSINLTETINSPHQSSRGDHIPKLIVCHIADGTYEGTKAWFLNAASQTSSNYVLGQDGRVCQCVPLYKMAWCNGTTVVTTDSRYYGYSTVPLVQRNGGNANQYSVSIECEGYSARTGGALTEAQLDALVDLIREIQAEVYEQYGHTIPMDREHVVGHYEINPKTKPGCPGAQFPWSLLMARLQDIPSTHSADTLYRVQVGAFKHQTFAREYRRSVEEQGYQAFLALPDEATPHYRVQIGAFASRENAEAFCGDVRRAGLEAFLVVSQKDG